MEWLIPIIIWVLAGVILLIVEAFMPGFGVPGISGIILLLAGVAMTWYEYGAMVGLGTTVAVLALVGVALSLTDAPFWLTILTLSVCVFGTSCTGFWLGAQLGRRFGKIMEALGGVALAGIGTKLLLGGLGIW